MLKPPPSVAHWGRGTRIDGQSIRLKVGDHLAPDALRIHLHADPRRRGKLYRVPLVRRFGCRPYPEVVQLLERRHVEALAGLHQLADCVPARQVEQQALRRRLVGGRSSRCPNNSSVRKYGGSAVLSGSDGALRIRVLCPEISALLFEASSQTKTLGGKNGCSRVALLLYSQPDHRQIDRLVLGGRCVCVSTGALGIIGASPFSDTVQRRALCGRRVWLRCAARRFEARGTRVCLAGAARRAGRRSRRPWTPPIRGMGLREAVSVGRRRSYPSA